MKKITGLINGVVILILRLIKVWIPKRKTNSKMIVHIGDEYKIRAKNVSLHNFSLDKKNVKHLLDLTAGDYLDNNDDDESI